MKSTACDHRSAEVIHGLTGVLRQRSPDAYYDKAVNWFRELLGADHAALLLLDASDCAEFAAHTGLSEAYVNAASGHFPWAPGDLNATAFHVQDVRRDPSLAALGPVFEAEQVAALTFVPLAGRERLVGKVMAYFATPTLLPAPLLHLAEVSGAHIAAVLECMQARIVAEREALISEAMSRAAEGGPLQAVAADLLDLVLRHPGVSAGSSASLFVADTETSTVSLVIHRGAAAPTRTPQFYCMGQGGGDALGPAHHLASDTFAQLGSCVTEGHHLRIRGLDPGRHVAIPLSADGHLLGMLALATAEPIQRERFVRQSLAGVAAALGTVIGRHRLRKRLDVAEARFRVLLDAAPVAATIHHEGRFLYVNRSMARSLGYRDREELRSLPVASIIHPDDRTLAMARIARMNERDEPAPEQDERFIRADGSTVFARVTASPIWFEGRRCFIALARDVSEERALEAQAALQDRLAAMGQLAAMVGHDINNPLTYVLGNVAFALEALESEPQEAREALEDAAHGATLIQQITSDLRRFVHMDEQPRDTAVAEVMGFVVRMVGARFRGAVRLVVDIPDGLTVRCAPSRLAQVVMNLMHNAARASEAGTPVVLRARPKGDRVQIQVIDQGRGMSPEMVTRAFQRFQTEGTGGTGLGLFIAERLVANMGGAIHLESSLGVGTTATVWVPRVGRSQSTGPAPVAQPVTRRATVMLVDDDQHTTRSLRRMILRHYDVESFHDGASAVVALVEGRIAPTLILCDVMMPGMSGPEVYRELARVGRPEHLRRFCFMTGGAFTEDATRFLENHEVEVVFKPLRLDTITRLVNARLGRA